MRHLTGTRLIVVLAVIGALAVAGAAAASRTAGRATTSAADQVRTAERTLLQAAVDGDKARARPLLAPDFQLIDVMGAPETREDYLATIDGGVDFVAIKPVSPIKVRIYGNTAVARLQEAFGVVAGPDRLKHRAWTTNLFRAAARSLAACVVANDSDTDRSGASHSSAQGAVAKGSRRPHWAAATAFARSWGAEGSPPTYAPDRLTSNKTVWRSGGPAFSSER